MNARGKAIAIMEAPPRPFDFESVFHTRYGQVARVIARVIRDPARAEELAAEVLWKFWRSPRAQGDQAGGWLLKKWKRLGRGRSTAGLQFQQDILTRLVGDRGPTLLLGIDPGEAARR